MLKRSLYACQQGGSVKFRLPCSEHIKNDPTWIQVKDFLSTREFNILIANIRNFKQVVLKFGTTEETIKEYEIGHTAFQHHTPNFIKFLCHFTCNDTIQDIQHRNFMINTSICKGDPSQTIGMIAMPYYPLGSINSYTWNRQNFPTLKNVIKQVVFALLLAYETFGFVHADFHVGNVLIRATKKTETIYGQYRVATNGVYPMIMDFGRSRISETQPYFVYKDIQRFLNCIRGMDKSDLSLDCNLRKLVIHIQENTPVSDQIYQDMEEIIDNIQILYAHSEIPKRTW